MADSDLQLERILGCTTLSNSCFSSSPSGDIFYAAGTVVVQYNPFTNKQVNFFNTTKPISCLTVSTDGKYLGTGERGHQPRISIWEIATRKVLVYLSGHRQGVGCLAFSPDSIHLVSVGFKYDKQLYLWDWARSKKVALQRLSNKVIAVCWSHNGTYFVTCGDRHLKFWTLESTVASPGSDAIVTGITGKPGSITEQLRDAVFMDVCLGAGGHSEETSIFCTTSTGVLCAFNEDRLMIRWVQLESPASYALSLFTKPGTPGLLVVGCADGIIRAFSPETLEYTATLPLPCPLVSCSESLSYAACYGLVRVAGNTAAPVPKLACVYADHSVFVWDISNIYNVAQYRSFTFHRACIWDIQFIDQGSDTAQLADEVTGAPPSAGATRRSSCLPPGSFATCSADGSIRIWNLDPRHQQTSRWKFPYSRDMLHLLELEDSSGMQQGKVATSSGRDVDPRFGVRASVGSSVSSLGGASVGSGEGGSIASHKSHNSQARVDLSSGLPDPELPSRPPEALAMHPRAMAIHPSGRQLACGDRLGRLRVYDLASMTLLHSTRAHAAEILTLHYSPVLREQTEGQWGVELGEDTSDGMDLNPNHLVLLASAGRDRLVHIFDATSSPLAKIPGFPDVNPNYAAYPPVATLDNHSSSITIVRFTSDGKRLISCGGDRTMVFTAVNGPVLTKLKSVPTPHGTINGLAIEATNKFALTSGQDKRLNIWNLQSGKHLRSYKNPCVSQELYKSDIDPSGTYVATAAFDKTIYVFDFFSGELVTQCCGHSELVTGVKFSPDGRRLISIGGEGCVMVFKLPDKLVRAMQDRLMELYGAAQRRKETASRRSLTGLGALSGGKSGYSKHTDVPPPPPSISHNSVKNPLSSLPLPPTLDQPSHIPNAVFGSDAHPPLPPQAGIGKWSSQLEREGGGYELFGRKISVAQGKPDANPNRNKFTLELSGIELSLEDSAVVGDPATLSEGGGFGLDAAGLGGSLGQRAGTFEEEDDVMQQDADVSEFSDGMGLDQSDDGDGDDLFAAMDLDLSDEKEGGQWGRTPASIPPNNPTQEEVYLSDFEEEDANSPKPSSGPDRGDEEDDDDELNRTASRLDSLEKSAIDLESWLEERLRDDGVLDASVFEGKDVLDDLSGVDMSASGPAATTGRSALYLVKEEADADQDLADDDTVDDEEPAPAETPKPSVPTPKLNQSLSSAFFQSLRDPARPQTAAQSSLASESTANMPGGENARLETKRRETAAMVGLMKERLRAMGVLRSTVDVDNGGWEVVEEADRGSTLAPAVDVALSVQGTDSDAKGISMPLPPAPPSPASERQSVASAIETGTKKVSDEDDNFFLVHKVNAQSSLSPHVDPASNIGESSAGLAICNPPMSPSLEPSDYASPGPLSDPTAVTLPSPLEMAAKLNEYKNVLRLLADAKEAARRSYDELLDLRMRLSSSLSPGSASCENEAETISYDDTERGVLAPPHPAASTTKSQGQWGSCAAGRGGVLGDTDAILEEFRMSLALDHQTAVTRSGMKAASVSSHAGTNELSDTFLPNSDRTGSLSSSAVDARAVSSLDTTAASELMQAGNLDASVNSILERYSDRLLDLLSDKLANKLKP